MSLQPHQEGAPDLRQSVRLREVTFEFARAWQHVTSPEQSPTLDRFLPPPEDPMRRSILEALIVRDLEERWRKRQFILVEQYVEKWPELGTVSSLPARLLLEEFRVRHQFGDQPPITTYQRRFPAQFDEMKRLMQGDEVKTVRPVPAEPNMTLDQARIPISPQVLPLSAEYHLIKKLGEGSYGEVWSAQGPGGFDVAIKVMYRRADHEDVKRELQSLEIIKKLRHPFLLSTIAYWQLPDRLLIAMELAGGTLHDRLEDCKKAGLTGIPIDELLKYTREAAEALDYLHGQGVQHRDVKPANLLLVQGYLKVADFGLVRNVPGDGATTVNIRGTPLYMAPEVWVGELSPASDLYSLAVTYAELRTGKRPFGGRGFSEIKQDHLTGIPALTPLSQAEREVVQKALDKDPTKRHPSCLEFVSRLENALGRSRGRESAPTIAYRPKSKLRTVSIGLGLLVVLAVAGWLLLDKLKPEGTYSLGDPDPLLVNQGETATLRLPVVRNRFGRAVTVTCPNLPEGVEIDSRTTESNEEDVVFLNAKVRADARPGKFRITAKGESRGHEGREAHFDLTVVPLPLHCRPLPPESGEAYVTDASSGITYHRRLEYVHPKGGPTLDFVVVKAGLHDDPKKPLPTFYILEEKVTVEQFRAFAAEYKTDVISTSWNKGDDGRPAVRIAGVDALRFATSWIEGGRLPTAAEWDKASGRYASPARQGPYVGTWGPTLHGLIAISPDQDNPREKPMRSREARADLSPFDCWDMSGNGLEWTGDSTGDSPLELPVPGAIKRPQFARTRAMDFDAPEPFMFKYIETRSFAPDFTIPPNRNIGFRVVLPVR